MWNDLLVEYNLNDLDELCLYAIADFLKQPHSYVYRAPHVQQ